MDFSVIAAYGSIVSMSAALALIVYQLIRQRASKAETGGTFGFLVLFLLFGWLMIEIFETAVSAAFGNLVGFVHFLMMLIFAVGITVNWRRSSRSP